MFARGETEDRLPVLNVAPRTRSTDEDLEEAVVRAVTYSDIFDYPLTLPEIHRYLVGVPATLERVQALLLDATLPARVQCSEGYYHLEGRERLVQKRLRRAEVSATLWPKAVQYGHVISRMPFVRMVAITGALSMDSSDPGDDLDYFVVTEPGRLWVCRAFIVSLVRLAARRGDVICPNYFISTRALVVSERNLYTAHEMTQMIPVSGLELYLRMRELNPWVEEYLPNAAGAPRMVPTSAGGPHSAWALVEAALRLPPGAWLEQWEMNRKVTKLRGAMAAGDPVEADFGVDWCKGHFGGYGRRTLGAMADRLSDAEG